MFNPENHDPKRVFHYFAELSAIPRGSGNMQGIAGYCENFAKAHDLRYIRDAADNVVIFKNGTKGFENAEAVILQGHLDMVCQKTANREIDFEKEGITLLTDGDLVKADGTTLGADNGIAVAMILAILESNEYAHPPIEAVFTVDEEVGMLGALKLDMSALSGKKMINIDSEDEGTVTVSCAGGRDFTATMPLCREKADGTEVKITVGGLKGGHSGIEINGGRVNADLLAGRILHEVKKKCDFKIIEINGGDKANAIPNSCTATLCTKAPAELYRAINDYASTVKAELFSREPNAFVEASIGESGEHNAFCGDCTEKLLLALMSVPNGVIEMSREIDGLVETSLNLGVLKTDEAALTLCISLRSNKLSAMDYLESRLAAIFDNMQIPHETTGFYPPWEFNDHSTLQQLYCDTYKAHSGNDCRIEAIHAGLECGVFSAAIDDLDCISIGPQLYDVHTTAEMLCISSAKLLFEVIIDLLSKLK